MNMFGLFKKKEKQKPKNYFIGVMAIRTVPYRGDDSKLIMSIYVPDAVKWLEANCTEEGWCNVNIVPMAEQSEKRSHVAYLNERLTPVPDKNDRED